MGQRRTNLGCGSRHHWTLGVPYLVGYLLNVSLVYHIYFRETVHGEQCENDLEHSCVNHWQNSIKVMGSECLW